MTYSVALIGLGGIGMRYDSKLPDDRYVFSHARAFSQHPDFILVGAADSESVQREHFAASFKVKAYATVAELMSHTATDVVVIASPTNTHLQIVREVLEHACPKLILCEKPLAYDEGEAREIVRLCRDRNVRLLVNYIRRADPGVVEIKARLDSGLIRTPFKAIVWYSKGLLHNGSHFLDLMNFWFGPVHRWSIIAPGDDFGEQDAEPDFRLAFDTGTVIFCAAKEENFSHYTVEVVASNGRLRYEQGGIIFWQPAGPHPTLDHYLQLQSPGEEIQSDMNRYQYRVASQASNALNNKPHTLCDGITGAANIKLLQAILRERLKNQE